MRSVLSVDAVVILCLFSDTFLPASYSEHKQRRFLRVRRETVSKVQLIIAYYHPCPPVVPLIIEMLERGR